MASPGTLHGHVLMQSPTDEGDEDKMVMATEGGHCLPSQELLRVEKRLALGVGEDSGSADKANPGRHLYIYLATRFPALFP